MDDDCTGRVYEMEHHLFGLQGPQCLYHCAALHADLHEIQVRDEACAVSLGAGAGQHLFRIHREVCIFGVEAQSLRAERELYQVRDTGEEYQAVEGLDKLLAVDGHLGIFPFEPAFYARYGYECTYVGNPTAEEIAQIAREPKIEDKTALPTIALMPGSRESEVKNCLPVMLEAARRMAGYQIVVTAAPALEDTFYTPYMRSNETLTRETYTAVRNAQMAVVNSGTATLETALLGCPQVAVYYLACSWFWRMVRWAQPIFFTIRHFTLVNILAGKEVIKELVANDFTADKIEAELHNLEKDEEREKIKDDYAMIQTMLGESSASQTAAKIITEK